MQPRYKPLLNLQAPKILYSSIGAPRSIHSPCCVQFSSLCFIVGAYYPAFESRANRAVSCSNVLTRHFRPQLPRVLQKIQQPRFLAVCFLFYNFNLRYKLPTLSIFKEFEAGLRMKEVSRHSRTKAI